MPITGSHLRLICFGYENSLITKRPESDQAGFKKDFRATAQAARARVFSAQRMSPSGDSGDRVGTDSAGTYRGNQDEAAFDQQELG